MHCKNCNAEKEIINEIGGKIVRLECGHIWPKPTDWRLISRSQKEPFPYQYDSIKFAEKANFRCIIAHEMGLGKTICAIGTLVKHSDLFPSLIVVKSSIKMQWMMELLDWGNKKVLPIVIEDSNSEPLPGFDVYIASYNIFSRFAKKHTTKKMIKTQWGHEVEKEVVNSPFYTFPWKSIILDEVQSIKNLRSKRSQEIFKICEGVNNVIALSGTPIKNHAGEYFPIFNLLYPDRFPDFGQYERKYMSGRSLWHPKRFYEDTEDFIFRKTREEVAPQLPKVNRVFHHVDFENERLKAQYEAEESIFIKELLEKHADKEPANIIGMMSHLRHIVGVNKIKPTVEKAEEFLLSTDRKLVIYCHHIDVQQAVHKLLSKTMAEGGMKLPLLFHAGLSSNERHEIIQKFKNDGHRIFVASTLAASEGLNLQFCSDCIFAERQWTPADEEQAESRFIRIGQTADRVDATYMIASGTIDEYFTALVEDKRVAMKTTLDKKKVSLADMNLMQELFKIMVEKGRNKIHKGW